LTTSPDIQVAIKPHPNAGIIAERQAEVLASYYGGKALRDYIPELRPGEDPMKLDNRRKQVIPHYENYVDECAATYTEQIFRSNQIQRTIGNNALEDWLRRDYDVWFQNEVCGLALVLPECFVIVNPVTVKPASRMEQEANQIWPRPTFVLPSQITNYGLDSDGRVTWCVREMKDDKDVKFFEIRDSTTIRTVDEKGIPVAQVAFNGKMTTEAPHNLPNCGVVRLAFRPNHSLGKVGHAFLHRVVDGSIACLRYTAMLVEQGYFHMQYERVMSPGAFEATKIRQNEREPGTIIQPDSDPETKVAETHYLDKPGMVMDQLKDLVFNKIPVSIYRAARLRDRTTNQIASGASKMMDAVPELAALSSVASYFQRADYEITRIIALGFDPELDQKKIEVQYPTRFDLKTGTDILLEISTLAEAEAKGAGPSSPTAMIELKYAAFRALLPDLADKELGVIWKELNAKPDPVATPTTDVATPTDALKASEADPFGAKAESPV
jgi:hypothetical protein